MDLRMWLITGSHCPGRPEEHLDLTSQLQLEVELSDKATNETNGKQNPICKPEMALINLRFPPNSAAQEPCVDWRPF